LLIERTFESALHEFVTTGMMDESDTGKVVTGLPPTARKFNVIPGIEMLFDWPLSRAVEIDRRNGMVEEFKQTANKALEVCGCELFGLWEDTGA
jgi:hypothetical protein